MAVRPVEINTLDQWLNSYKGVSKKVRHDARTGDYLVRGEEGDAERAIPHLPRGSDSIALLNSTTLPPEARAAVLARHADLQTRKTATLLAIQTRARELERQLLGATAAWDAAKLRYAEASRVGDEGTCAIEKGALAERAREVGTLSTGLDRVKREVILCDYPVRTIHTESMPRRIIDWVSHDDRVVPLNYIVHRRDTTRERVVSLL